MKYKVFGNDEKLKQYFSLISRGDKKFDLKRIEILEIVSEFQSKVQLYGLKLEQRKGKIIKF